ncbi:MAG: autotransporter-associated beta strand repeat-containing protein [Luteolibacter sp.]
MKTLSNPFFPRGLTRFVILGLGLTFAWSMQSAHADTNWTGSTNQDWATASNWSNGVPVEDGVQGAAVINIATGNFPQITAVGTYQADFDIKVGAGVSGRLDQSAGTLATGEGNWFILGFSGVQATYNLTGSGSLKVGGLSSPTGNFLIGLDAGTVSTWGINTTGTVEVGGIFASGAGASTGIINMDAGTVNASGETQIGGNFFGNGGNGQLNMTGGTLTANILNFARGSNNAAAITGTATISGGTLNSKQWFTLGYAGNSSNVATVNNNGGTINVNTTGSGNMEMGVFDATVNVFTLNSGSLNLQNNATISYGNGGNHTGTSTITQNNGTVTFYSDAGSSVGGTGSLNLGNGGSTGTYNYNLNGGTLTVPQINKSGASATGNFNFNGGTLKAAGTTTTFLQGLTAAKVQANGAIINSNGFDVTVAQALVADSANGGLTKNGTGALTLSGVNTYTGNTTVNAGTLNLAAGAGLKFVPGASGVTNKIAGAGTVQLDGDFTIDVSGASTASGATWDLITTTGTVTIGSTFTVTGFTPDAGSIGVRKWTSGSYQFDEAAGILSVVSADSDSDGMADAWETTYFGDLSQGATGDFDGDGTDNLTEFRLGLIPNSGNSRFVVTTSDSILGDGYTVSWQGKAGLTFTVQRSTTLAAGSWTVIQTVTPVADGPQTFTDPAPVPTGKSFYRVTLQP